MTSLRVTQMPTRATSERIGSLFARWAGALALTLIYAPVVWLALMSVSGSPLSGIPGGFTLRWYQDLFAATDWLPPLVGSVGLGLVVGITCALTSLLVARRLPTMRRSGWMILIFIVPLFVPGILVGVSIFIYFRVMLGLTLGWWSIFVAHFTWAYPFALLAVLVTTLRFDRRLIEAAADVGATPWRSFRDIELPIILPGVVAATLFGFLLSFNELPRSLLLHGQAETLPLYEWVQASAHQSHVSLLFALSTLIMLTSMVLIGFAFMLLFGRRSF